MPFWAPRAVSRMALPLLHSQWTLGRRAKEKEGSMTNIAVPLVTSAAAPMTAVDALALLAAIVVAVSVVGILVAWVLLDPSSARPYRLAAASPRRGARPVVDEEVPYAA